MSSEIIKQTESMAIVPEELRGLLGAPEPESTGSGALPAIKILKDACMYEFPGGEKVPEFTGNIVYYHPARFLFEDDYGEGDGIPSCASSDGVQPNGGKDPRPGPCSTCHFSQFGSGKNGKGMACRRFLWLYVAREGDIMPLVLKAPPTSLRSVDDLPNWRHVAMSAAHRETAKKYGQGYAKSILATTQFTLKTEKFAAGSAAIIQASIVSILDPVDDRDRIANLCELSRRVQEEHAQWQVRSIAEPEHAPNEPDETYPKPEDHTAPESEFAQPGVVSGPPRGEIKGDGIPF